MVGLSASELAPEALCAGEVIEYYSRAFVCGDRRGYRRAVVTSVDGGDNVEFPIAVDTEEVIPPDMMVKRVEDRSSHPFAAGEAVWRKLRTFKLVTGTFSAPTRASALNKALKGAITAAIEGVHEALQDRCEEIVPEAPRSSVSSSPKPEPGSEHIQAPSTSCSAISAPPDSEGASSASTASESNEERFERSSVKQIIDLVSSGDDSELQTDAKSDRPSAVTLREAATYVRSIPNRYARAKIRHQAKKQRAQWHVPRSRKRRHLAKCAITRSGSVIYHAKGVKAVKFAALQKTEVKEELESLHARRTLFPEPASTEGRIQCRTVPCPTDVELITTCKLQGVRFPDIGRFDPCQCFGDCFWDTCSNVASASFYILKYCKLGARCSNAPRTLNTLKLFDTGRVGLGVYTTAPLDIGDVLGEYCGELTEFPAVVEGQPPQALKHNSGYTLIYNAKSVNGNYVYVDALRCGSITRFISHSCDPNAAFVEQQTRSQVRVLVKMIRSVKAGTQVTVHYGTERWFTCACDKCWQNRVVNVSDSEEE